MGHTTRIRKLASETAVYGVSSIFGRLINFLLFPFYSNVFPPDVYGPVVVLYAAFVFLNIFYQYGMESAYLKYAAAADSMSDRSDTFSTAVLALLGTSILFSAAFLFFRQPVGAILGLEQQSLPLLYYAAGILLLDTLAVVPYAELRLENRPWRFAIVRTAGIGVNIALVLSLILGADMGIEAIFIANLIASAVSLLMLIPVFASRFRLRIRRALLKELLVFGLPFVPGGLGYAVSERVNIFFLERLPADRVLELYGGDPAIQALSERAEAYGPSVYAEHIVGVYGGIVKLAIVLALVVQMFRYAWQPFFLQHDRDEDSPALFARVFTLLTAVLLFVYLAVSFFAVELVSFPLPKGRTLIAPAYWLGLSIIPIALLGYVFQGWYYHFSAGAYIRKHTRYFVSCTLAGSTLAVILNILFVPKYGMAAAAWATSVSYAVMSIMLFLLIRRVYAVPYDWKRVLLLAAAAGIAFAAWFNLPVLQVWWAEALLLAGYTVVAWLAAGGRKISEMLE